MGRQEIKSTQSNEMLVFDERGKPEYPAKNLSDQGPVSRKSRELFGPEKPFVKLRPAFSVKLVFSYVVKGIKIKITAKFRASRRLRFEDTKRIMSPEYAQKVSGLSRNRPQACVSQKTRKLLGAESFSGLFSGYFLGSRKVFLKAPGNSPDSKRTFRDFSRVGAWPASGGD